MVEVDDNQFGKLKTPNPSDNQSLIGRPRNEDGDHKVSEGSKRKRQLIRIEILPLVLSNDSEFSGDDFDSGVHGGRVGWIDQSFSHMLESILSFNSIVLSFSFITFISISLATRSIEPVNKYLITIRSFHPLLLGNAAFIHCFWEMPPRVVYCELCIGTWVCNYFC
ncbi:hypothetical protein PRUPE_2G018900 [Prunus persica]|uniref:Uncharacterized protein n=1 Tax=Prunus persica TaxID=3760 RepID=A0A251Q9I1_PRUPE|nr:hypothetical protein PRUPE_2G018900 [Prunus persica]